MFMNCLYSIFFYIISATQQLIFGRMRTTPLLINTFILLAAVLVLHKYSRFHGLLTTKV